MDIKKIKEIVNNNLIPDGTKRVLIIRVIAEDSKAIHDVLSILEVEREQSNEIITDINLELSRAHIYIDGRPEQKSESKDGFNKGFILDEISKFYIKYKGRISHCFNRFN